MDNYDVVTEGELLSAIMKDQKILDDLVDDFYPDLFVTDEHQKIASVMIQMNSKNRPVDSISIYDEMSRLKQEPDLGYLGQLFTAPASDYRSAFTIVKRHYCDRKMAEFGQEVVNISAEKATTAEKVDRINLHLKNIDFDQRKDELVHVSDYLADYIDVLESRVGGTFLGCETMFSSIDHIIKGFVNSELIIIAARPAIGKTTFALNIISNNLRAGKKVAFFSLEMPKSQIVDRLISSDGQVLLENIRHGRMDDDEWARATSVTGHLKNSGLHLFDNANLNIQKLKSIARRVKRSGLDLIVVDYLQLMSGSGENRVQEISEISRGLKSIAKELDIPVIALSQLNRGLESRSNKRPVMSDLRESGSIEQDADMVMFLYRDDYYDEDSADYGTAEVNIGKNRNGATGTTKLVFRKEIVRFFDMERNNDNITN